MKSGRYLLSKQKKWLMCVKYFSTPCLVALFCLTSCTAKWVKAPEDQKSKFATWVDAPRSDYKVVPGDDLSALFPLNPELNYEAPVAPDGDWSMPLAGTIKAGGQTLEQINQSINHTLAQKRITPDAYASVSVRSYAGRIYVAGQVKKPGPVSIQNDMDALQAISAAGGFLDSARSKEIVVIRRSADGRPMVRAVNINALIRHGDPQQAVVLQAFDTIFVPQSSIVEADQWVEKYITKIVPFNQSLNYNIGNAGFYK